MAVTHPVGPGRRGAVRGPMGAGGRGLMAFASQLHHVGTAAQAPGSRPGDRARRLWRWERHRHLGRHQAAPRVVEHQHRPRLRRLIGAFRRRRPTFALGGATAVPRPRGRRSGIRDVSRRRGKASGLVGRRSRRGPRGRRSRRGPRGRRSRRGPRGRRPFRRLGLVRRRVRQVTQRRQGLLVPGHGVPATAPQASRGGDHRSRHEDDDTEQHRDDHPSIQAKWQARR